MELDSNLAGLSAKKFHLESMWIPCFHMDSRWIPGGFHVSTWFPGGITRNLWERVKSSTLTEVLKSEGLELSGCCARGLVLK